MKELKELLTFAFKVGELTEGMINGVGFEDVPNLIAVGKAAGPGIKDAKLALAEYANLTDAQSAELETWVVQTFNLQDDKVEMAIEMGLKVVIQLNDLVQLFVSKPVTVPVGVPK